MYLVTSCSCLFAVSISMCEIFSLLCFWDVSCKILFESVIVNLMYVVQLIKSFIIISVVERGHIHDYCQPGVCSSIYMHL